MSTRCLFYGEGEGQYRSPCRRHHLFPQPGKGVVNGKQIHRTFPVNPTQPITAWGLIGAGIRAYDHMDGVGNRYGVHTVILEVDGEEVFRSVVDRFAYEETAISIHGRTDST